LQNEWKFGQWRYKLQNERKYGPWKYELQNEWKIGTWRFYQLNEWKFDARDMNCKMMDVVPLEELTTE